MHEVAVTAADFQLWAEVARERWSEPRYARSLRDRTAFADEGDGFNGWEWLIPIIRNSHSSIFEHLGKAVLVVDEPSTLENYLGEVYENLAARYQEIDQADDIALTPEELYLPIEELRTLIQAQQRIELRTLGRAAAELDQDLALDAEAPRVQIGRGRGTQATHLSVSNC
jgi:transcription-repair coupling factor (superfamily II helicase)